MPFGFSQAPPYAGGGIVPTSNYGANAKSSFNPYIAGAGGMIGAGLGALFGDYEDPSKVANEYMTQIPGQLEKYFNPYINRGNQAGDVLQGQYGNLLNDPGNMLNKIGQGYQQSPGFKFALQQALQGAGHAAAAGGMAGSPQHEQQSMELATNLANQDYGNWISRALGLYGQGLSGEQGMYGVGAQAGMGLGENIAANLANQAKLAYAGQAGENERENDIWGAIGGGIGTLAAFL